MPSTNPAEYPEEEGIYSDGDSQCGETSQNLDQDGFLPRYEVGPSVIPQPTYTRLTKPEPTPRKNRNRGLFGPSGTESSSEHHTSSIPSTTAVENGHLPQNQPPDGEQMKMVSKLKSDKWMNKKQFYFGIGLFVIPIFLFQLWIIQQMHNSYIDRIDLLESEHRDSTLKLFLEISDLKTKLRQEINSIRTHVSIEFSRLRSETNPMESGDGHNTVQTEKLTISKQVDPGNKILTFQNSIKLLKNEVKSQFAETWIELYSGIIHTMEQESARPAAIVLLIPPNNQNFGTCFARKFAKIVNSSHGRDIAAVKEIYSAYWDQFSTMTEINDDLEAYLTNTGKSVIVHDPDKIQREDFLMIFHSFCDNFMAFDKSATFIFVIHVPDHVVQEHGWSEMSGRGITHSILNGAWKDVISVDKRAALIARIAVNVVSLKGGDSCT